MFDQELFIWLIFSTWQADNHKQMFRLSDSKMILEFPSGQPLVSSPVRYNEPCNFLTKRALVSQQSTLVVAKDPNISHYLNLSVYLQTIILAII